MPKHKRAVLAVRPTLFIRVDYATGTHMTTSGMHRRPFESRHLVQYKNEPIRNWTLILYTYTLTSEVLSTYGSYISKMYLSTK